MVEAEIVGKVYPDDKVQVCIVCREGIWSAIEVVFLLDDNEVILETIIFTQEATKDPA